MGEIYKIVNGLSSTLKNLLLAFSNYDWKIRNFHDRNFQVLSTELRKIVNYGLETGT